MNGTGLHCGRTVTERSNWLNANTRRCETVYYGCGTLTQLDSEKTNQW